MNTLKMIVWIVMIAFVVWAGYAFFGNKALAPVVEQGAPVIEKAETAGDTVAPASEETGVPAPAPAPTVTPAPAPAPTVTPPPAPAPKENY